MYDGDTVQLAGGEVIRLLGIDAPESNSRNRRIPAQPHFRESRDALAKLVARKKVLVRTGNGLLGHYGRTLAYLHLPGGGDVQLAMLRGGHAMAVASALDFDRIETYAAAEREARKNRAGMWAHEYFAVHPLARGMPKRDGPVRVSGVVTGISLSGRRVEIMLNETLRLQIAHAVWQKFWRGVDARNWLNQPAHARGRIKSKSQSMHIWHPVMLAIGETTP